MSLNITNVVKLLIVVCGELVISFSDNCLFYIQYSNTFYYFSHSHICDFVNTYLNFRALFLPAKIAITWKIFVKMTLSLKSFLMERPEICLNAKVCFVRVQCTMYTKCSFIITFYHYKWRFCLKFKLIHKQSKFRKMTS